MPYHQIVDMICALQAHNVAASDYKILTIPGNDHSFAYWYSWDGIDTVGLGHTLTVRDDVIAFLDEHLK